MHFRKILKYLLTSGIAGFLIALSNALHGQPFESVVAPFQAAGRSAVSWCDYDNDHDLDILICGVMSNGTPVTRLYRNDDGVFADTGMPFTGIQDGAVAWGDYDLDGDMDLLLSGNSETGDIVRIYRNDGGSFTEINPGIAPVQQGTVCWVDIDNDGDLDIFITGSWIARIYYNNSGMFTAGDQDFGYFSSASAAWGDFDNDGDLDLLIAGDSGAGAVSKIFRNDAGIFTDIQAGLSGLMAGTVDWIDYDNDGDLDVAISGFDDALEAYFFLYKNQGAGFELINAGIDGFAIGSADWGDYDNDGDPDLLFSGKASGCGAYVNGIYRNEGNDVFNKTPENFILATRCSLSWGDYDNDGDLDFILAGINTSDIPIARLYRNQAGSNIFVPNNPPLPPDNLLCITEGDMVHLSWSAGWDNQTPAAGLSYNIMLGTEPVLGDIVAPMSDLQSGYRYINSMGNSGQRLTHAVGGLIPGTYYWSVQAIDQAFEGSPFAVLQSFEIISTEIQELDPGQTVPVIYPNPATGWFNVLHLADTFRVTISDMAGRGILTSESNEVNSRIDISNLPAGVYLVQIYRQDVIFTLKLIKASH